MKSIFARLLLAFSCVIVIGLYSLVFFLVKNSLQSESKASFEMETGQIAEQIKREVNDAKNGLRSVIAHFGASDTVSELGFNQFVEQSDFFGVHPQIRALAVGPFLYDVDLSRYQMYLDAASDIRRALGYPETDIKTPEHPVFTVPMLLVESPGGRERIVGFDVASSNERLWTAQSAIVARDIVMTPPVQLSQDRPDSYSSVLLLGTVPSSNFHFLPETSDLRNKAMVFAASYTPGAAISDLFEKTAPTQFGMTIVDTTDVETVVYSSPSIKDTRILKTERFHFAARSWEFRFHPSAGYYGDSIPTWLTSVFIAGLLLLLSLAYAVLLIIRARDSLADQVAEQTQDLVKSKEAAEQASIAKSEFLSIMSHEIRTPLNGVLGLNALLEETDLNAEQKNYVDTMKVAGASLMKLINDILDFSKLEANKMELVDEEFEFQTILLEVTDLLSPQTKLKSLRLSHTLDSAANKRYRGDSSKIRQVLINLVGNAIKFTDTGEVSIRVEPCAEKNNKEVIKIAVSDTGIGISDSDRRRVFEGFSQADASISRKHGGTGLGLAICRHIVKLLDGEIDVESTPGEGSSFWFTVTLQPASDTDNGSAQERVELSRRNLSVLVVEDDTINQLVARKLLQNLGCQVEIAPDGIEALTAIESGEYELVFMDMMMPKMDGVTATKTIRQLNSDKRNLPIIAMTANALEKDRDECLAAGMNDYISKPIQREKLVEVINRTLDEASR